MNLVFSVGLCFAGFSLSARMEIEKKKFKKAVNVYTINKPFSCIQEHSVLMMMMMLERAGRLRARAGGGGVSSRPI